MLNYDTLWTADFEKTFGFSSKRGRFLTFVSMSAGLG